MANLADCAVAIAKSDLDKMDGAITKVENDGRDKYEYATKQKYKQENSDDVYTLYTHHAEDSVYRLRKNGEMIIECNEWKPVQEKIEELNLQQDWGSTKVLADNFTTNGWRVDWRKLDAYSYDYTPYIAEYDDHVTIYFGGRWDFPSSLENKLNEYGVSWQGAGCEDGCDWEYDEFGNSDFGLRIRKEKSDYVDDDGTEYWNRYVYDSSNRRDDE